MYRHRPPQPGSQPFSTGPRPPRPPHQHRGPAPNIRGPPMNFQFPRPTQLPKELESALTIQGSRDMDHRTMDHRNMPNQHQTPGIGQGYSTNPMTSDNRSDQHHGADWSKYQPPNKLFAGSHPNADREIENRAPVTANNPNWSGISNESQPRSTTADAPGLYTSESAGSILASFGLSNEDLEVLSHYPDDQLTPDTLPFILRDIQINKSAPKTSTSNASSSFSSCNSDAKQRSTLPSPIGHSNQEVPSLLTVTQTAGKVIDYGHASRADEECETRTAFKREQLSGERVVKILPSSPPRKVEKPDSRLVQVERTECGDKDYRKLSTEDRKSSQSPEMDSQPKRNLDRDYRRERPTARTSSETRSESSSSKRSSSSMTGVKSHTSSKKLPTAAMIADFSAQTPKVFPYTCSLCHMQCDQEKDWDNHLNTVNHTAACRELRNKYPQWKPYPSRSDDSYHERYTRHSSASRSRSRSPVHGSHSKYRPRPHYYKSYRRSHSPHSPHHHHHHHYHHSYPEESSYRSARRPHDYSSKHYSNDRDDGPIRHSPSSSSHRTSSPESKVFKTSSGLTCKPPPAKKKKKVASPSSQEVECLLYLTGIPLDATEEDVTELVGSYGVINNVLLLPCTEEERQRGEGQKASVCMVRGEDARTLAQSTNLFIREMPITVAQAKVPEKGSFDADNSTAAEKPGSEEADLDKQKAVMLITGLPEGLWSKSDILQLIQPFGSPSDIIEAKTLGKALVSVPNLEIAEEIEKFHNVMPAKIHNTDIKIVHLKWHRPIVSMKTPMTLYNLLMGRPNPLFGDHAVTGRNRLLVISNVPTSGHLEVEKLVRRFGTVIKTLPLHDVLICEMASVKMAVSVFVRFKNFPCILQNNPLSFTRCLEPKIITDPKEEKKTAKTKTVKKKTDPAVKAVASDENEAQDDETIQEDKLEEISSAAPDKEVEVSDIPEDVQEHTSPSNDTEAPPGGEKPDTPVEMRGAAAVAESNTEKNEVTESKEEIQSEVKQGMKPGEVKEDEKRAAIKEGKESLAIEEKQDAAKEKEEKRLKDARDRKEKEARDRRIKERDREAREKERREKERRTKEEERLRREKGEKIRREKERREMERRDKERWERKRSYEDHRQSSTHIGRDDGSRRRSSPRVEEEEQEEDFPFDLGDFVTVDEVGDVGDLPESPAMVAMGTDDAEPNGLQQDGMQESEKDNMVTSDQPAATLEAKEGTTASGSIHDCSLPPASSPSPAPQPDSSQTEAAKTSTSQVDPPQDGPPPSQSSQVVSLQDGLPPTGTPQDESSQDEPSQIEISPAETPEVELPEDGPSPTGTPQNEPSQTEPSLVELPQVETPADELSSAQTPQIEPAQVEPPEDESSDQLGEDPETDPTPSEKLLPTPPQVGASLTEAPVAAEGKSNSQEKEMFKAEDQTAPDTNSAQAQSVKPPEELHTTKEPIAEKESNGTAPLKSLPPYNPATPVGLEFLVPKTGFFCKPCNRFFTGNREFEITHCKSLKHYQNLQEFLKHVTSS
ncbi:zinc finger protein 638-like isoform X2 [Synchiropus splendidus]|uniref:zinc finger protein 638-like isoform X2 n=1 Tax=Synchiropus splendidus TaxID=270530 RepID=UPI00237DC1BA|nr:zinc finger protein 638-like isoform X2 [Synchiropus splendidus]